MNVIQPPTIIRTSEDILNQTIQGLALGVQVWHIATTPLQCCAASERAETVLRATEWSPYSQIPVRDGGRTCGILERSALSKADTLVSEVMKPLDDSMLVAAGTPLTEYLQIAASTSYRLVIDGGKISGIITRSDLQKLPVRIVVFTFVTNLELLMADVIRCLAHTPDRWKKYLSEDRCGKVEKKFGQLQSAQFEVDELTCTEFCDKRTILKRLLRLPGRFTKDLEEIEKLRNSVCHAGEYAQNESQLKDFVGRFRLAQDWTNRLQKSLNECSGRVNQSNAAGITLEATGDDLVRGERPA